MTVLNWDTAADHDAAQADAGTHHEQPTGSDYAPVDTVEMGPPSTLLPGKAPVAVWFCQEDSDSTIYDVTGNGHDMTVTGGTPNVAGPLGFSAWSFDGVDDEAKGTATSTVNGDVTLGALIKTAGADDFAGIVTTDQDSTVDSGLVQIYTRDVNVASGTSVGVQFEDEQGNRRQNEGTINIADDAWHLVGTTWDSSAQSSALWFDGSEDTNATLNTSQGFNPATNPFTKAWQLGVTRDDFRWFTGEIAYAFVDLGPAWTASDWSALWDAFTGPASHTSSAKVS